MSTLAPAPSLRRQRTLAFSLNLAALLLLALSLYVRTLPPTLGPIPEAHEAESAWWGLWPVTHAPAVILWVGVVLVIVAAAWGVWAALRPTVPEVHLARPLSPHAWAAILWAISILLITAFAFFPIVHTRWGDAYMLSKGLAWPDPALRITHSWQAPLDVFLHSRLWHWLGPRFGWEEAAPVYRLLSPLAGGLYLAAAVAIATNTRMAPPWLTFGLLATLGVMQLFFGYIENYSFAAAAILIYLWLALRTLDGRAPLWPAASVLAITHALHPSTIALAPSLLVLGALRRRAQRNKWTAAHVPMPAAHVLGLAAQIVLPMLIVGGATFAWMEWSGHGLAALTQSDRPGGSDGRWLVPLWEVETRWEHYTLFSWAHLRDILNEQLLVAPVVLPALLLAWLLGERAQDSGEKGADRPAFVFLLTAAFCYLLFTLVWNPDYGGQRDWDLFSLAAIPLALLAAQSLARALPNRRLLIAAMGAPLLFQALHTAVWVYSNTRPWQWPL